MTTPPPPVDPRLVNSASGNLPSKPARRPRWLLIVALPVLLVVAIASYNAVVRSRAIDYAINARKVTDQIELERISLQAKIRDGTATAEDLDKMKAATSRAADEVEKVDKPKAAMMRDFIALCTEASRELVAAFSEFQKDGGLEPATLSDRAKLDARLAKLRAIKPLADQSLAKINRLVDDTKAAGRKNGLSDAETQQFIDAIGKDRPAQLIRIRELDVAMVKEMEAYLGLLSEHFDAWSFKDGQIIFSSNQQLSDFQAITRRLGAAAKEQGELIAQTQGESKFLSKP